MVESLPLQKTMDRFSAVSKPNEILFALALEQLGFDVHELERVSHNLFIVDSDRCGKVKKLTDLFIEIHSHHQRVARPRESFETRIGYLRQDTQSIFVVKRILRVETFHRIVMSGNQDSG